MISDKKEGPKVLAAAEEGQTISRSMLVWANTFPDKPVAIINYEFLDVDMAKPAEVGMTLSTIPGTYITSKYILGGYQAEYQFEMLYRIKPGNSIDARLEAVELLNRFGDWARTNKPELGEGIRALRVEPTTQAAKLAALENGYEDYQILMRLTYEVGV